jgi:hypothetical protein
VPVEAVVVVVVDVDDELVVPESLPQADNPNARTVKPAALEDPRFIAISNFLANFWSKLSNFVIITSESFTSPNHKRRLQYYL